MITPELLETLKNMNVPMVILFGDGGEDSELLKEMKRHHDLQEKIPILQPYPA